MQCVVPSLFVAVLLCAVGSNGHNHRHHQHRVPPSLLLRPVAPLVPETVLQLLHHPQHPLDFVHGLLRPLQASTAQLNLPLQAPAASFRPLVPSHSPSSLIGTALLDLTAPNMPAKIVFISGHGWPNPIDLAKLNRTISAHGTDPLADGATIGPLTTSGSTGPSSSDSSSTIPMKVATTGKNDSHNQAQSPTPVSDVSIGGNVPVEVSTTTTKRPINANSQNTGGVDKDLPRPSITRILNFNATTPLQINIDDDGSGKSANRTIPVTISRNEVSHPAPGSHQATGAVTDPKETNGIEGTGRNSSTTASLGSPSIMGVSVNIDVPVGTLVNATVRDPGSNDNRTTGFSSADESAPTNSTAGAAALPATSGSGASGSARAGQTSVAPVATNVKVGQAATEASVDQNMSLFDNGVNQQQPPPVQMNEGDLRSVEFDTAETEDLHWSPSRERFNRRYSRATVPIGKPE